ncbi:MAG TPA: outer membrane beta-barrel protein [Terracidiphilus sp.]|nr:outer membrane beta-barrel protein [Terracidiphilus sp.]
MTHARNLAAALVVLAFSASIAIAQAASSGNLTESPSDDPAGNVHIGTPIVIPLNPTAKAVHLGWGLNVGGGYNFTRRHGLIGEYLWNDLFPTNEALTKLRTTLNDPSLHAGAGVMALTGNYRYELRGQHFGTYFIGGAGLYYRHVSISKEVITGSTITCDPFWVYWGVNCTRGVVTENQTIGSFSASGPGYNGGIGFTIRAGEPPYRFYAESRYHYAPSSRVDTQLIDITFGFRY